MINLKNGETKFESYDPGVDDYLTQKGKIANFESPDTEFILMAEVRGPNLSLWIDHKEVAKNVFTDTNIGEDNIYIVVDFESTEEDTIQVLGYDEFPVEEQDNKLILKDSLEEEKY